MQLYTLQGLKHVDGLYGGKRDRRIRKISQGRLSPD